MVVLNDVRYIQCHLSPSQLKPLCPEPRFGVLYEAQEPAKFSPNSFL